MTAPSSSASPADPRVSVVIPSIGDAGLRGAVDSVLASADACGVETEVIVVWQRDGTPDLPAGVRVVHAHPVNVSYARNRGLEAARAALVGFLDEDEVADGRWVGEIVRALGDADAAFGPIDPIDDQGRPHCLIDHGSGRVFARRTPPWLVGSGGNMVFRRDALMRTGMFDLRFGTRSVGVSAEETELIWRLLKAGRPIRWAPDMIVHHPTKTDDEILASRYPYGFGSGRLLRKSRSPRLIANYLHAIAHANVTAVRARDRRAGREARRFAAGLLSGLLRARRWDSPPLDAEELPASVASALHGREAVALPVSWGRRPHYAWSCGDRFLHAYVGPTSAQLGGVRARLALTAALPQARIPAVHAHGRTRDALWVLEDRVDGAPLDVGAPEAWWGGVAAWILSYARLPGPAFGETDEYRQDAARWLSAAPPALRPAATAAVERAATLPTGPTHGDLQPKNIVSTRDGVCALDWEWCGLAAPRGSDLIFLAATHAGVEPSAAVLHGLLEGRNPAFGDVLGPLAELGLHGETLRATVALLLVKWAANEQRRVGGNGRLAYGDMLVALAPALTGP